MLEEVFFLTLVFAVTLGIPRAALGMTLCLLTNCLLSKKLLI